MTAKQVFKITPEEEKIKSGLKEVGKSLRNKSHTADERLGEMLENVYETNEGKGKKGYVFAFLKRPLVWIPAVAVVLFVVVNSAMLFRPTRLSPVSPMYDDGYYPSGGGDMYFGASESYSGSSHQAPTFKQRFLSRLGQNEASPYEIAKRGPILEKDLNVEIMTDKKDEASGIVQNAFTSLGGFISSINNDTAGKRRGRIYVYGKIPANNIEAFRILIKNFAEEEKYYREGMQAQSRTADMIEIEKKIKEVEGSIKYLEDSIQKETNPVKKAELEKKLADNKAYFAEREETKKTIEERVDFVDVKLTAIVFPKFWQASSADDLKSIYVGFEEPTLLDKFKINATRIIVLFIQVLSYTFWLIPIIVWLWWKKRKTKEILNELE
ncbi:MAG: DUF4349 domain-containing protein [bacterium]|nr:DUF4349 domain-containing protein [bacterium]